MTAAPKLITLGCRLNAAESETMRRLAREAEVEDAIVVNTCAVTNEAVRTARQRIRRARRARPDARIIVTGCAAQTAPDAFAAMPEVDVVIGNREKLDAQEWRALSDGDGAVMRVNDIMATRETALHLIDGYGERARAFLQVQNGCDHRCTFCIIPYGRGNSRSVPIADIVKQARRLIDAGHQELVLTGVDLTSYGADLEGAPRLGRLVATLLDELPDLFRLRLSSIDGAEIDGELFERMVGDERVAPYMHLSLQAGDNLILKRMKRRHTREQAIALCESVRARRSDVAFGADIIAGFPTETDEQFERSVALVDEANLSFLHVFPFSPREGTPAARMPQLPRETIKARADALRETGRRALHEFLGTLVGGTADAVLESGGRARLGNFASVKLTSPALAGGVASVHLRERDGDALLGEIVS